MDNNLYVYIPRDIVLNYKANQRKHRGDNFRTLYQYKHKRRYRLNDVEINEIDVYNIKEIQKNTLYKSSFKSQKDQYFDWYYCLKEKYNDSESIYINNEKSYTKKKINEYSKNRKLRQNNLMKPAKSIVNGRKFIVTFD